jgi:hypothetical protein
VVAGLDAADHPHEPRVRGEDEVSQRLDERVLTIDPLVERRWRKPPRALDGGCPHRVDHVECFDQTSHVARSEVGALGVVTIQLVAQCPVRELVPPRGLTHRRAR